MTKRDFSDLPVGAIMDRWPETIAAFIDLHMHCVGCPIAMFHDLPEAAFEHGLSAEDLEAAVAGRIGASKGAPPPPRRR